MGALVIEIDSPPLGMNEYGGTRAHAAYVARARQLLDTSGAVPANAEQHEIVLSLGGDPTELAISPGLWGVELVLPSGELRSEQVRVGNDEERHVRFQIGESPHEWLGWQFAEGSVPERDRYEATLEVGFGSTNRSRGGGFGTARPPAVPAATAAAMRKSLGSPVMVTDSFARASGSSTRRSQSQVTLLRFLPEGPGPDEAASDRFDHARGLWQALVSGLRLESSILELAGLEVDTAPGFFPGSNDAWHDVWRFAPDGHDEHRRFAMVISNRAIEFVSLPLPWSPGQGLVEGALLELVIDKRDGAGRSRTSVTLRDQNYLGLLSYLKTGSLALAASVAEGGAEEDNMLVDLLQDKRQNPLAACAAGYALLGAIDLTRPRSWYPWLANLSEWFPWLPDGAILYGRWLTLSGQGEAGAARKAFLRAFRRGVPFYSLGLSWLLDGLRQFPDDPDCVEAARLARQVSLRSDVSQVFTVLGLHATAALPTEGKS